jgi:Putative amidoligase enzyme
MDFNRFMTDAEFVKATDPQVRGAAQIIVNRGKAAHDAITALTPRPFTEAGNPSQWKGLVTAIAAAGQIDFDTLKLSIFGGAADVAAVLSDPTWTDRWRSHRVLMSTAISAALATHDLTTDFVFTEPGFKVAFPADAIKNLVTLSYSGQELFDIVTNFKLGFSANPNGPLAFGITRTEPRTYETDLPFAEYLANAMRLEAQSLFGNFLNPNDLNWTLSVEAKQVYKWTNYFGLFAQSAPNDFHRSMRRQLVPWYCDNISNKYGETANLTTPATTIKAQLEKKIALGQANKDMTSSNRAWAKLDFIGRRAENARSSRKYGVEIEVIDAGNVWFPALDKPHTAGELFIEKEVFAPPGWSKIRDGSLRPQMGDGKMYDPWEFVSPPLERTYDRGLRMICEQVDHTIAYARAGVHIHVDAFNRAGELIDTDGVNRLLEIYALVSPLLYPIIRRRTEEFCKPMDFEEWALGWHSPRWTKPTKLHRAKVFTKPRTGPKYGDPRKNIKARMDNYVPLHAGPDRSENNWGRYREVNLESLVKHGTIEFRAMGAVYGFEYIAKWAWFVRELTNYAQNGLPVAPFYGFTTLGEVLAHLEKHAVETLTPHQVQRPRKR